VATPVNWKPGTSCVVSSSVKNEELAATFPKGVDIKELPSGKQYLRYTPQPNL
jgi:1-Cys peroxiredoxin 6